MRVNKQSFEDDLYLFDFLYSIEFDLGKIVKKASSSILNCLANESNENPVLSVILVEVAISIFRYLLYVYRNMEILIKWFLRRQKIEIQGLCRIFF